MCYHHVFYIAGNNQRADGVAGGVAGGVVEPGQTSNSYSDFSQVSGDPIGRFEHTILCSVGAGFMWGVVC